MSDDLTNAVLTGANLTGADLRRAVLSGANLRLTDLTSAVLLGADLTGADLTAARYDADTVWPEGFDPEAAGAIRVDR